MADRGTGVESQIKELKVSGHTMALEPGLYVVFNAPGGPVPDQSGLPGVRITPAPAAQGGRIEVTGFGADGWIGADSAALVRVGGARAELMVTVYQAQDSKAEAPKLQVVLLAPAATTAAPDSGSRPSPAQPASARQAEAQAQAPAAPSVPKPSGEPVEVVAHIYGKGDLAGRFGGWMGEPGSQRWIEGFGIAAPEGIEASDIEYQAVLGRGWLSPWSEGGQFCGSRGMSLPILGMRVRLRGAAAKTHKVVLSATFVDGTQIGPVGDGEPCEAPSLAALEAFQMTLEPLAKAARASRPLQAPAPANAPVSAPVPAPGALQAPSPGPKPGRGAKTAGRKAPQPAPVVEAEPVRQRAPKAAEAVKPARKAREAKPAATVAPEPEPVPVAKPAKPGRTAPRAAAKRTPATTRRR